MSKWPIGLGDAVILRDGTTKVVEFVHSLEWSIGDRDRHDWWGICQGVIGEIPRFSSYWPSVNVAHGKVIDDTDVYQNVGDQAVLSSHDQHILQKQSWVMSLYRHSNSADWRSCRQCGIRSWQPYQGVWKHHKHHREYNIEQEGCFDTIVNYMYMYYMNGRNTSRKWKLAENTLLNDNCAFIIVRCSVRNGLTSLDLDIISIGMHLNRMSISFFYIDVMYKYVLCTKVCQYFANIIIF